MTGLIESLRQRVEETRRELEGAKKKTQQARATEEMLATELTGYERAVAAEERREGKTALVPLEATSAESETPVNRTSFAEAHIRSHNATGVTPPELFKVFGEAGITLHRNYVYSILNRLATKGRIRERRGRYFPVEADQEEERR